MNLDDADNGDEDFPNPYEKKEEDVLDLDVKEHPGDVIPNDKQ